MQLFQKEMIEEAEHADLTSDDDVIALVKELKNKNRNIWKF